MHYTPDETLARMAGGQHGIVRVPDLRAAGLNSSAVAKRRRRGVLHLQYPGVYSLGHAVLSREGRWLAAVFAGGMGAVLSHLCAAALWRLIRYVPAIPDVLVRQGRRPVKGINFHQYRKLDPLDAMKYRGIPVTTVARTLVDLTDILDAEELANVIHEAQYRERFSLEATQRAMERANGRKNLKRLEQAITDSLNGSAGTRSRNEREFLKLLETHKIPKPLVNTKVLGIEVDCHWPQYNLVAEIDGPGHARPRTQREDRAVDAALTAAGYTILRGTPQEVRAALPHEVGAPRLIETYG
jgi:predicted transcriptional regulator of viral defense system